MKLKNLTIKLLAPLPTLLLLSLIFGFSAQNGEASGSLSLQVSLFLVRLFSPLFPTAAMEDTSFLYAESIHYFVRKAAHMTEYFLLTLSLQLPLAAWFHPPVSVRLRVWIGFFVTVLFAALDEFHQYFVPGRSGNLTDVCIDSVGAMAASLCLIFFYRLYRKKLAR